VFMRRELITEAYGPMISPCNLGVIGLREIDDCGQERAEP
jgi:hypothetical protein